MLIFCIHLFHLFFQLAKISFWSDFTIQISLIDNILDESIIGIGKYN